MKFTKCDYLRWSAFQNHINDGDLPKQQTTLFLGVAHHFDKFVVSHDISLVYGFRSRLVETILVLACILVGFVNHLSGIESWWPSWELILLIIVIFLLSCLICRIEFIFFSPKPPVCILSGAWACFHRMEFISYNLSYFRRDMTTVGNARYTFTIFIPAPFLPIQILWGQVGFKLFIIYPLPMEVSHDDNPTDHSSHLLTILPFILSTSIDVDPSKWKRHGPC